MLIIVLSVRAVRTVRLVIDVLIHLVERHDIVAVAVSHHIALGVAGLGVIVVGLVVTALREEEGEGVVAVLAVSALLAPAALLVGGRGQNIVFAAAELARLRLGGAGGAHVLIRLREGADDRAGKGGVGFVAGVGHDRGLPVGVDGGAGAAGAEHHDDLAGNGVEPGGQILQREKIGGDARLFDRFERAGIGAAGEIGHAVRGHEEQRHVVAVSTGESVADGAFDTGVTQVIFRGNVVGAARRTDDVAQHFGDTLDIAAIAVGRLAVEADLTDQQRAVDDGAVCVWFFLKDRLLCDLNEADLLLGLLGCGLDDLDRKGGRKQRQAEDEAKQQSQHAFHISVPPCSNELHSFLLY